MLRRQRGCVRTRGPRAFDIQIDRFARNRRLRSPRQTDARMSGIAHPDFDIRRTAARHPHVIAPHIDRRVGRPGQLHQKSFVEAGLQVGRRSAAQLQLAPSGAHAQPAGGRRPAQRAVETRSGVELVAGRQFRSARKPQIRQLRHPDDSRQLHVLHIERAALAAALGLHELQHQISVRDEHADAILEPRIVRYLDRTTVRTDQRHVVHAAGHDAREFRHVDLFRHRRCGRGLHKQAERREQKPFSHRIVF